MGVFSDKDGCYVQKKGYLCPIFDFILVDCKLFLSGKKFVRGVHDDTVIDVFHGGFQESTIYEWT